MKPMDTSQDALNAQFEVLRELGPERRLRMALGMSDSARQLARAGIRLRHPGYNERQIETAVRRLVLGEDLADRVWPHRAQRVV